MHLRQTRGVNTASSARKSESAPAPFPPRWDLTVQCQPQSCSTFTPQARLVSSVCRSILPDDKEFRVWLIEERRLNPERISKDKRKREFSRFVDEHNAAAFPHEKFYDMAAYDRRMALIRNGDTLAPETSTREEKDEWDKKQLTYNFEQDQKAHLAKIRVSKQ